MARHRIIGTLVAAAAALCICTEPASASSTLLSGYGGPGEGNQAILGSTLVGGGGGGTGSGRASSSTTSASSPSYSSPSSIALPTAKGSSRTAARARQRHAGKPSTGEASKSAPRAYPSSTASTGQAGGGGALGLTGDDVVYIVLAFGALALTALLTARLTGRAGRAGGTQ